MGGVCEKFRTKGSRKMNYERVTIQECIAKYENEGREVIINDGKIIKFIPEE